MATTIEHHDAIENGTAQNELNVAVLLPDGRGIRNFILGPFVEEMKGRGEIHALHVIPEDYLGPYRAATDDSVHWHPLLPCHDTAATFLLRNSLAYSQMYWVDSFAMRFRRNLPIRSSSLARRTCLRLAKGIGKLSASPGRIKMLEKMNARAT